MGYVLQVTIDDKFFQHSFVYPDLSSESDDLQEYIASDLLEISHKRALETSGEWALIRISMYHT